MIEHRINQRCESDAGTKASAEAAGTSTTSEMVAFNLRALARFRDEGPDVQILGDTAAARTVLFCFKPGQRLKEHQTSSQILVQVLRGQIAFTVGAQTVAGRAGTLLQVEANVPHGIEARTTAVVLVTMTPSPAQHSLQREVFDALTPLVRRVP
jgi:quercetin dioxygenase-like cupin family protein